jgi:teichuronic acid biosynthesis glycosyltransferase TuaG
MVQDARQAPSVSVITPAHNAEKTIEATIASVQAQTVTDWELVVCDDASTDSTAERVAVAAGNDPRIHLVRNPSNAGPAAARNLALTQARGLNVAFLDSDDRYEPTYLEAMTARLDPAGRAVGIVCCDAWLEDDDGRRVGRYAATMGSPEGTDLSGLLRANRIFVAAMCPRALVDEVGRFSTDCFGTEDYDLWLRILERGYSVAYVSAPPLVTYHPGAGSLSSSRARMAQADQAAFERALARGRLNDHERRIARARLELARAAEAVAARRTTHVIPALARAAVARVVLGLARER